MIYVHGVENVTTKWIMSCWCVAIVAKNFVCLVGFRGKDRERRQVVIVGPIVARILQSVVPVRQNAVSIAFGLDQDTMDTVLRNV